MTSPLPIGHTAGLHMPVIAPAPEGAKAAAHYAAVLAATSVTATPTEYSGLEVAVSNPAFGGLFAMTGGLVTFIPPGKPLPTLGQEPSPGAGSLHLQTWAADIAFMSDKKKFPGVPPLFQVLYLNVRPDTVRTALGPWVRSLSEPALKAAWDSSVPYTPNLTQLQENYLDRIVRGDWSVLVRAGTPIGEAGYRDPSNPAAGCAFTLRSTDSAGSDLSPLLHVRGMPSLDPARWTGHPLIAQVANVVVPVDIHLQFEVWESGDVYRSLPAGVPVELVDYDPVLADDVLATELTDSQGRVHFTISNLPALGEQQPDLYFRVRTQGMQHAGHTLPDQWSTKGWNATDRSPGYYAAFAGTRLGNTSTPLVFRIGFDFHARLVYALGAKVPLAQKLAGTSISVTKGAATVQGSTSALGDNRLVGMTLRTAGDHTGYVITKVNPTGPTLTLNHPYMGKTDKGKAFDVYAPAPPGISVALWDADPDPSLDDSPIDPGDLGGIRIADLRTDKKGEVHGIRFDLAPGGNIYFEVSFEIQDPDPAVQLPRAYVAALTPYTWKTCALGTDRVAIMRNDSPSLGDSSRPLLLRCSEDKRNVYLYFLKCLRELHITFRELTAGAWKGVKDLRFHPFAPASSFSWPVGFVNLSSADHWDRQTIMHEIGHQLMWEELGVSSPGIAYEEIFGDLTMVHYDNLIYSRELALAEGWGNFVGHMFEPPGHSPPVNTLVRGPVSFVHGASAVTLTGGTPWNENWNLATLHVEGENTWYSVVGPPVSSAGSPPTTHQLTLDRPYEGSTGTGKRQWLHLPVYDKQTELWEPLFPTPPSAIDGKGERAEGAFTNALSLIFERQVKGAKIPETLNGDVLSTAPWLKSPPIRKSFLDLIWNPFKALRTAERQDSRQLFEKIKAGNTSVWHEVHAELQHVNIMPAVPSVASIVPSSGPAAGGQRVTITGDNFVRDADVLIGGKPASKVVVLSATKLEADTPPGTAGGATVVVHTLSGSGTQAGGYTYT
jgi:hypothetical protein